MWRTGGRITPIPATLTRWLLCSRSRRVADGGRVARERIRSFAAEQIGIDPNERYAPLLSDTALVGCLKTKGLVRVSDRGRVLLSVLGSAKATSDSAVGRSSTAKGALLRLWLPALRTPWLTLMPARMHPEG